MIIKNVFESDEVIQYLQKRDLIKQYKKAKNFILLGYFKYVSFKKREPKKSEIYYFRVNKQFRAIGYMEDDIFYVLEIDNHK